ncbi:MAG TPA: hypothetical protein VFA18_10235 [Gemmataceae bacterium]|jgi:hypothetical protein|nr:hypothetical protein [Gemmataceae bacterium]
MFGKVMLALSVLLLTAESAWAYVGPGADIAFISYAMTLLIWILTVFSAILLWPVYALVRKIRGRDPQAKLGDGVPNTSSTASPLETAAEEARVASHADP